MNPPQCTHVTDPSQPVGFVSGAQTETEKVPFAWQVYYAESR